MSTYERKTQPKISFTALVSVGCPVARKLKKLLKGKKGERLKLYRKIFELGAEKLIAETQNKKDKKKQPISN